MSQADCRKELVFKSLAHTAAGPGWHPEQRKVEMRLRKNHGTTCCKEVIGRLSELEIQSVTVQTQLDGVHHRVYGP